MPAWPAVRAEGGAAKGDKTLLDVLMPVAQGVRSQLASGRPEGIGARIVAAAAHGLHATTHMQAKHGLAADLGVGQRQPHRPRRLLLRAAVRCRGGRTGGQAPGCLTKPSSAGRLSGTGDCV